MKITRLEIELLVEQAKDELNKECPAPTQDLELNTLNRNRAIEADFIKYGPLNLSDEGYWEEYAKKWGDTTSAEEAKNSNCSNCVAFDISPRMEECMPGATDEDGRLGYCWMHHFKCHSARTCYTWAKGGPIDEDEASYDWQKRNLKAAIDPEPIEPPEEKKLTYNDFVRMVRNDMMAGAAPDEKPSDKQVASRAKSLYNDYLQGASVDDLFEAKKKKKDPPIGKPKRGGPKAYYVYVRDPKTKRIKKVTFGSGGLRAKINNPKARKAFAARHKCSTKTDRTKASYWSCRLPRYAKQLGLSVKNPGGFW